ncbi:putative homoserine acetyltransferase family protein [Phaeomoniella chlamydospora]|uniref:Putative homoserine acetyltransferase family protein n=1 Tax=Phaeomoniella chlamydospora TaxID=158046 RepID=A0A0G2G099_PHACM|nr:putative homoserine acetyltransferase family protein [Phaeomoniella chlamydospora]
MPSTAAYDPTGVEYFDIPNFRFQDGTVVPNARLAYRSFNPSSPLKALIPTCYGGRINTTLNFTTGALRNHNVIVVALFGNGESSSPSNTDNFPQSLSYQDCVQAQYLLLTNHLKIQSLDAVIGFSMGGQTTYHWAVMYPAFMRSAIPICTSARTSLHNRQFLEGPKAALKNSIDYADGSYRSKGITPYRGLHAFGRAYSAWLFSHEWFESRIFETQLGFSSLEDYTIADAEKGYDTWDPENLLIMAEMWQNGDITKINNDSSLEESLSSIKSRVLLMPGRTDQYFRVEASEKEMKSLRNAEWAPIESIWGHAAGGGSNEADTKWMDGRIEAFLKAGE